MRIDAGILPDSVRFFHEPDAFTEHSITRRTLASITVILNTIFPAQEKPVWTSVRQSLSITVL